MNIKRICSTIIAGLMVTTTLAIPVSAAEAQEVAVIPNAEIVDVEFADNGEVVTTYEFDVTPEMASSGVYAVTPRAIDQSFTFTGTHRGADRTYSGNYLRYSITVTDANGNAVDNTVAVKLYDYNHSYALMNTNVRADGSTTTIPSVAITSGRVYYFKYQLSSGTSRALRVRMQISSFS